MSTVSDASPELLNLKPCHLLANNEVQKNDGASLVEFLSLYPYLPCPLQLQ